MQKFIITLMLLIGFGFRVPAANSAETNPTIDSTNIIFKPVKQKGDTKDYPRMPAFSPIYGVMTGDILTIFSKIEGEADLTVTDGVGSVIMSQPVADLTCGYTLTLPAETTGLTVAVVFNGITYSATF